MKNNTSIILSLVGGVVIGSAVTCIMRDKCKMGKMHSQEIHKKIIAHLEQLHNFIASYHPEALCSCEDPACNCAPKSEDEQQ